MLKYQIFSCYAGYVGSEAYTYAFPEEADFQAFLKQIRSYAGYDTGVEVGKSDRVVTLSTCVSSRRDYRYIVHGKLTEEIANWKKKSIGTENSAGMEKEDTMPVFFL